MRPRDRAALILVAIALAWSCLALGGALRWAAVVAAGLGLATAVPYVASRRSASRLAAVLVPLVVMAGLTALQLVPLPIAIAEQVVPAKVALIRDNALAWGAPEPTWVVASYDPPATLVELAKLLGYLALAWTCVRLAADRHARRWLAAIVAGIATLVAAVTLVHLALGLHLLYGVYRPTVQLPVLGPLIGVNHLASLLAFAVPLALACALRAIGPMRLGWGVAAATLAGTALLTGSRGGAIGLGVGLVVLVTILIVQRRAGTDDARHVPVALSVPAIATVAAAVVLLGVLTAGDVSHDLASTSLDELHDPFDKFQIWVRTGELSASHRWLGVGKGAFEPAFAPHAETGAVTYSHAENGYLQAVIDWGLPGAALLFLALGSAAIAGLRRWRQGPLEAGALAAVATLAVHDLADFSIELPGVAMMAIAGAAIVFPARLATAQRSAEGGHARAPRAALVRRVGALTLGAIVVALALSPLGRTAREDNARTAHTAGADRLTSARAGWARHPADFALAGRAAEALFAKRDPRALKVIARALAMSSNHAGLHHLAGRMLARSNRPAQSAVEFTAAARWARDVAPIVRDVLGTFQTADAIAHALPLEPRQGFPIVRALGSRTDAAYVYAQRLAELYPRDAVVQSLLANTAMAVGAHPVAVRAAAVAWRTDPLARYAATYGRALQATGDAPGAIALLGDAVARTTTEPLAERAGLYWTLVGVQTAANDLAGAKTSLERLRDLAVIDRALEAKVHLALADIEDRLGNRNQAAWERAKAREIDQTP